MPHCIIEHTDNIKDTIVWNELFSELYKILIDLGEFKEPDIKSRVIEHKNYYIGNGNPEQAFVTLDIQIMDERIDEFKKRLAQSALDLLSEYFEKTLKNLQTSISVQISEIHRNSYSKKVKS